MGGSGGGASGAVSYPAYITTFHGRILDHSGTDEPDNSFIDAFDVAYANSPFTGAVAYDPTPELTVAGTGVIDFHTAMTALDNVLDFNTAIANARSNFPVGATPLSASVFLAAPLPAYVPLLNPITVTPGEIDADVEAMDALLTTQIEEEELPRYRAGMLNINAVHSSAYIIGEAIIRASKDRALAKYATEMQIKINEQVRELNSRDLIVTKEIISKHQEVLRDITLKMELTKMELDARYRISKDEIDAKFYMHREELVRMSTISMLADLMKKIELHYQHAHLNSEVQRVSLLANKEEVEEQLAIDESDAKWEMELFRYAGIILAAPSGGVAQGNEKKSRAVSAIAGAVSGAAAGAAIGTAMGGPGYGTAIGAIAGVGLSFLQ